MFSKKIVLFLAIGIIAITAGVFSINNTEKKKNDAALRERVKVSLTQIADTTAKENDFIFEKIRDNTVSLALSTKDIYENPSVFDNGTYWKFDERIFKKNGLYLNKESDVSTVFIPNFVTLDAKEKRSIEHTAALDMIAPNMLKSTPDAVAMYTVDIAGITRYFPNIIIGDKAPVDYDAREDVFYKQATSENDPGKEPRWSQVYLDVVGNGLMITVSAPIYTKQNGFMGIFASDVTLDNIIKKISEYKTAEGSYAFLIDKKGQTIVFTEQAYKDILNRPKKADEKRVDLTTSPISDEFSPILKRMMRGLKGFESIHSGKRELFIAYAPLKQTEFSVAIVADAALILKK